jgi:myo-inositol-1(or 4)-monophosphatase
MIRPSDFVRVMRLAARQAGAVARQLRGRVIHEHKPGQSSAESEAVTAVDRATQDVVLHLLHDAFPGIGIDAEEDTATVALFPAAAPALVVLDPIDGTLNYTRGSDDYAVMAALSIDGLYQASIIDFPEYEVVYWATLGGGCFRARQGGAEERVQIAGAPDRILVSPKVPRSWRQRLASLALEVEVSRCSAVDASAPAIGRARAGVAEGRADRRRAIGFLLTLEAGGHVLFGEHTWRGEDPASIDAQCAFTITAESPAYAEQLRAAIEGP